VLSAPTAAGQLDRSARGISFPCRSIKSPRWRTALAVVFQASRHPVLDGHLGAECQADGNRAATPTGVSWLSSYCGPAGIRPRSPALVATVASMRPSLAASSTASLRDETPSFR
jgi:hypothetical protein